MINKDIVEKIDTLVSELIEMKMEYEVKLSEKETAINDLAEQLKQREAAIEKLEVKAGEVSVSIKEKEDSVIKLLNDAKSLDNLVAKNTKDMQDVKETLHELKESFEHQQECAQKLDDFLSQQKLIDTAISNSKLLLSQIQEKNDSLATILKNLEKQTQALQQTQVSTCTDMHKTQTDIKQGLESIAALEKNIKEMSCYIENSLQTEIKIDKFLKEQQNHQNTINELLKMLNDMEKNVSRFKYNISSLENDISVSKNNYSKTQEDLIKMQQQVNNYFSNMEHFKDYIIDIVRENLYVQHVTLNNRLFLYKK